MSLERTIDTAKCRKCIERGDLDVESGGPDESVCPPNRWPLLSRAFGRVIGTWGNTLRFALIVVVVAIALRAVAGHVPWEILLRLLRQSA
jgi:hypothetical protein